MKTIDLQTTQNVTITYPLAGIMDRIVAFVIDSLLVSLAYWLVATVLEGLFSALGEDGWQTIGLFYIFFLLGYFFFCELLNNGQTVGKRLLGLRVVRLDALPLAASDSLLRSVFYLVDTVFSAGLFAILLITSTARHQRLGDLAANTSVIKLRSQSRFTLDTILNISTLADYEVTYPQVRQLSEADMLLVKNALGRYGKHNNTAHAKALRQLVQRLCDQLDIAVPQQGQLSFLQTLLEDYIVLTR